jgi:hypothetical protein
MSIALKDMTPEQFEKAEWKFILKNLIEAQQRLEEYSGGYHSWLSPAIEICKERSS